MDVITDDEDGMREALRQAGIAGRFDEVPVGAIVADAEGRVVGVGYNQPIGARDPSAHAEIVALRAAAKQLANYRLPGTTLYVTVEPCTMCLGAIVHARIARVVYGAAEPKTGAVESAHRLFETGEYNHKPEIVGGVLAAECAAVMTAFFKNKRDSSKPES